MTSPVEIITSRENPLVKELRRLGADGAAYRKSRRVWIEGEHLSEAAQRKGWRAEIAVISEKKQHLAQMECAQSAAKTIVISDALMREISGLESASGIGLVLSLPQALQVEATARSVVFDRLQDPGNAGSILRSAAAFGYEQIIALSGTVALWSPKVLRAGMGAHFTLRIVEAVGPEQLLGFKQPLAVTSSHRGQYLHQLAAPQLLFKDERNTHVARLSVGDFAWIFGHEGQGVSAELEAMAQADVRIAQPGGQESLNVAAAAAICLHASAAARALIA
jgi:RNA methyltransferase, TrmH family